MNPTLHIVTKDLRRLRWWLVSWAIVLLLPVALGVQLLATRPAFEGAWQTPSTLGFLYGLQAFVAYLLTILLLQEDAVLGTRQFWLTRPISRGRLLRAKALGVLVIVVALPVLVNLPWWVWNGFGLRQIATSAAELALAGVLVAIPAALIGTLTETLARAVLWTMVLVAALLTLGIPLAALSGNRALVIVGSGAVVVLLTVGMLGVIGWLFLTRRRTWSLAIPVLALPVLLPVVVRVAGAWHAHAIAPREWRPERAREVTVELTRAQAQRPDLRRRAGEERYQSVMTVYRFAGLPAGVLLKVAGNSQTWQIGGTTLERQAWPRVDPLRWWPGALGFKPARRNPPLDDAPVRPRATPSFPAPLINPADPNAFAASVDLPRSIVARMEAETPSLRSELWLELVRPEIIVEMPLAPGAQDTRDGWRIRVVEAPPTPAGSTQRLSLRETAPAALIANLGHETRSRSPYAARREPFLLAATPARELVPMWGGRVRNAVVNGVRITWRVLSARSGPVQRDGATVPPASETGTNTLALVGFETEAQFRRELQVQNVAVEPAPAPRQGGL